MAGRPRIVGRLRIEYTAWSVRVARARAEGVCVRDGNDAAHPGGYRCAECLAIAAEDLALARDRNRARGLCLCGEPLGTIEPSLGGLIIEVVGGILAPAAFLRFGRVFELLNDELHEEDAKRLLQAGLVLPAYEQLLHCSHTFNLLDARGAISVTERAAYIGRIRNLSRAVAQAYYASREQLGFPMLGETRAAA